MLTLRELPHLHQLASMLPGHSSSSFSWCASLASWAMPASASARLPTPGLPGPLLHAENGSRLTLSTPRATSCSLFSVLCYSCWPPCSLRATWTMRVLLSTTCCNNFSSLQALLLLLSRFGRSAGPLSRTLLCRLLPLSVLPLRLTRRRSNPHLLLRRRSRLTLSAAPSASAAPPAAALALPGPRPKAFVTRQLATASASPTGMAPWLPTKSFQANSRLFLRDPPLSSKLMPLSSLSPTPSATLPGSSFATPRATSLSHTLPVPPW